MGNELLKKKTVIIYSTIELVNGNSAGSARVMNYARALAGDAIVILLTFRRPEKISMGNLTEVENGIYTTGCNNKYHKYIKVLLYPFLLLGFVRSINSLIIDTCSLIHYTSTDILVDFYSVLFLIKQKKRRVLYEANEIRKYSAYFDYKPKNIIDLIKYIWMKSKYKQSEKLTKYYTGLLCISSNIELYFKRYNKNTYKIPILSDTRKEFVFNENLLNENEPFRIGFFGSVNYMKENIELLLMSIKKLLDEKKELEVILDLFGPIDKITEKRLPTAILKLGLINSVFYNGIVKQNKVLGLMKSYHLLVLPRGKTLQNQYGFSTKLSEYLLSGVPCLVTNVSDNGIYIKDKINGFIVEPDELDAFAGKLYFIYKNYNFYASNVSNEALNTAVKHFSYNNYSKKLMDILC